ncbi:MAG: hypothetical protein ABSH50_17275 [Bryobacteraceae bacterium]|jgi:hypothetical protein
MPTKKQLAANRRNAARCTGPKTDTGKAKCSLNALRHGFYSSTVILPGENPAEFDKMLHQLRTTYQPADDYQQQMVDELAAIKWKLRRVELFEAGLLIEHGDEPASTCLAQFDRVTQIGCRLRRMMFKLYKELAAIKASRPPQPVEAPSQDRPPDREPVPIRPTASAEMTPKTNTA